MYRGEHLDANVSMDKIAGSCKASHVLANAAKSFPKERPLVDRP